METPPARLIHSYGRRRGRRLRTGRATLVDAALPHLAIPPPAGSLDPVRLFPNRPAAIWLEVGFGGGEHLAAQAEAHRDIGFIGAEPYVNGVAGLLARIQGAQLDNIRLWPGDIRELLPALPDASLGRVFVLFPDPWPKARHHKRRLVAPLFLDVIVRVLAPGGELRMATDDPDYLIWIREHLAGHAWFEPAGDWTTRPSGWPATRYESKAIAAGRHPTYLRYLRRPAPSPEKP